MDPSRGKLSVAQTRRRASACPDGGGGGTLPPPAARGGDRIGAETRPNSPVTPPRQEAEGGARNRPPSLAGCVRAVVTPAARSVDGRGGGLRAAVPPGEYSEPSGLGDGAVVCLDMMYLNASVDFP